MSDFFLKIINDKSLKSSDSPSNGMEKTNTSAANVEPWIIGIIDDEPSMHEVTKLALSRVEILGRPLTFVSAFSADEGYELIRNHPNMALVLLDVVMETEDAGLKLVKRIRQELKNKFLQIILRTGQPGFAPEEKVIIDYEINAYKTKSELTRAKLFTVLAAGIRSYRQITALEKSRQGLRAVIDASSNLLQERSVFDFSSGVLNQIGALFDIEAESIFCVSQRPQNGPSAIISSQSDDYIVVAASHKYQPLFGKGLTKLDKTDRAIQSVYQVLEQKSHLFNDEFSCLYLSTPSLWEGVIVAEKAEKLKDVDQELLQVFCMNVAVGLENAKFFNYLNKAAYLDEVTGLYSRAGFIDHAKAFHQLHGDNICLYLLDVDYFHNIIESLGYEFGNKILKRISSHLISSYGEDVLIARLHSDVFALLLPNGIIKPQDIALRSSFPFNIDEHSIRLGMTVGAAQLSKELMLEGLYQTINNNGKRTFDAALLLRHAEIALKVAKENRRGSGQLFDQHYEVDSHKRMNLLNDLRQAITQQELFLVLQPKVHTTNENIIGYEALLRWNHPLKGPIPPNAFIPAVEKSGLYYDVDLYVAKAACQLLNDYPQITHPISINLSANSLKHETFVDELYAIFEAANVSLSRVELEITENALIHSDSAIKELDKLAEYGFTICLDDFGAGYSSLGYLLRLPLHTIKIDRAFVSHLVGNINAQIVLEGIIHMGIKLGKDMVVEGIETEQQLALVKKMGADVIQGFYFFKPLTIEQILNLSDQYQI
ncbi:bifunctional diguanylate cyclase/phosphodiesterase [Shewanella sp. HL-SH2]|uniref:bifunctional diguanylate cyclase/phosphodiesterase n=1 Tax=Shewanella sp. HL-SH2 TaxID=3436238 RepID=UPI003EBFBCC7